MTSLLARMKPGGGGGGDDAKVDYAEEGRKLLRAVNLQDKGAPARYSPLDALWRHPTTNAQLFVGNATTAGDRAALRKHKITHIVNCQDSDGRNYFEGDPELTYLRFSIGLWRSSREAVDGGEGTWAYFLPYFTFVCDALRQGRNVLVHCLAGAHRAGTAGVAMLMLLMGWDARTAVAAAKRLRPAIDPIGGFPMLLNALERAGAGSERKLEV